MPELPEVETIRKQLSKNLPLKIEKVVFSKFSPSIVKAKDFNPKNLTLLKINRKGKVMDFIFEDDLHMITGLGMSGCWRFSKERLEVPHNHIELIGHNKSGPMCFSYVDPRRFGKTYFLNAQDAKARLDALGVDISSKELTPEVTYELLQSHKNKILKPLLLDQHVFSGIGNYIASEVCAHARVLPTRLAGSLSKKEATALCEACKLVISDSLKSRGMTFHGGYTDATGEKGDGVQNLVVFWQETCGLCGKTKIVKEVVGGRMTYWCPRCQK